MPFHRSGMSNLIPTHQREGGKEATLSDNTYPSIVCLWLYLNKRAMALKTSVQLGL